MVKPKITPSKAGPTPYKKGSKPVETAQVHAHTEPIHHDEDTFTASSFPFNELIPNWSTFNPNTKNPATGSTFASSHHGGSGGKKLSDFKSFHLACCLEHIDKHIGGVRCRVRCMNVFTVDSNQCTTHGKLTHKDGPNRVYTLMKCNEVGTWGMLRDKEMATQLRKPAQWQVEEQLHVAAAARLDEAVANGEDANAIWALESTGIAAKARIAKKLRSEAAQGKKAIVQHDSGVDVVAGGRCKGGKKAVRSCWTGSKLGLISEN